jgi:hypothetical protein
MAVREADGVGAEGLRDLGAAHPAVAIGVHQMERLARSLPVVLVERTGGLVTEDQEAAAETAGELVLVDAPVGVGVEEIEELRVPGPAPARDGERRQRAREGRVCAARRPHLGRLAVDRGIGQERPRGERLDGVAIPWARLSGR